MRNNYPSVWDAAVRTYHESKPYEAETLLAPMSRAEKDELFRRDTVAQERIATALEGLFTLLKKEETE